MEQISEGNTVAIVVGKGITKIVILSHALNAIFPVASMEVSLQRDIQSSDKTFSNKVTTILFFSQIYSG